MAQLRLRPLSVEQFPALAGRELLLFDGDCRFCRAQVDRMQRWAGPELVPMPLQTEGLLEALELPHEQAMEAMHYVLPDGTAYRGLEAAVRALHHRPLLGRLALAYYVPGLRQLGDLGYKLVARYRYAIMGRAVARGECDGGTCHLHVR